MATTQIRGDTQIKSGTVKTAQIAIDADFDMVTHKITNLVNPANPQEAATKAYVDAQVAGVASSGHQVRAASVGALTLSNTQTVDGVALSAGDRCLVKNQAAAETNGIYVVVSGGAWTRATDFDTWVEIPGSIIAVEEGTVNADTVFLATADLGGTLNTTAITFVQLPGPSDVLAGAGLTRTGQTIDVIGNADTSITVNANDIQLHRDSAGALSVSGSGVAVAVDGATIEINTNALRVKPGGIGETQLGAGVYQKVANIITRETPSGAVNGANTSFVLANTPVAGSEQVYLNGILQEPGAGNDYTISGATITYLAAPLTGDRVRVSYLK